MPRVPQEDEGPAPPTGPTVKTKISPPGLLPAEAQAEALEEFADLRAESEAEALEILPLDGEPSLPRAADAFQRATGGAWTAISRLAVGYA